MTEEQKISVNFNISNSDFNEIQSQYINMNFNKGGTSKNMIQTKNDINRRGGYANGNIVDYNGQPADILMEPPLMK